MSITDVVNVAAETGHPFDVTGFCGDRGLWVSGDGGDAGLVACRGCSSADTLFPADPNAAEQQFENRQQLVQALRDKLLKDARCSSLLMGFSAWESWQFEIVLSPDGQAVAKVHPTKRWQ
jgi:hypothetical protein